MPAVKMVERAVFWTAVAVHSAGAAVSITTALRGSHAQAPYLAYTGFGICCLWVLGAAALRLHRRRSPESARNNLIPALVLFPCTLGLLAIGGSTYEFTIVSFAASAVFAGVPYTMAVAAAIRLFWTVVFAVSSHWIDAPLLAASVVTVAALVTVADVLIRDLLQEATVRNRLLNQARWSAARLPAITMSLEHTIRENRREAMAEERDRLAQLLHDSTGYALTATVVQLNTLRELTRDAELQKRIRLLEDLLRETTQEVKHQVSELREGELDDDIVDWTDRWGRLCSVFADCTGVSVNASISEMGTAITNEYGELVYRFIQESLTNAYRHGHATVVMVGVEYDVIRGLILAKVSDNGCGSHKLTPGNGLRGMLTRASQLGGTVVWDTRPGKGFDIGIDLPLREGTDEAANTYRHSG